MTREDYYENLVYSLTHDQFTTYFGVEPLDIWDFDYAFSKVHWNANLEYSYQEYLCGEE